MRYIVEALVIKAGFFSDAQDMITKKIQPMLDKGANNGWRLHTFTPTESAKGINIVLVWEVQ
jgi:hypothetical protein